jgi:hypothetical protein
MAFKIIKTSINPVSEMPVGDPLTVADGFASYKDAEPEVRRLCEQASDWDYNIASRYWYARYDHPGELHEYFRFEVVETC